MTAVTRFGSTHQSQHLKPTPPDSTTQAAAKAAIYAVGALFQTAKTLLSIPFIVIALPFAYILEDIGVLERDAALDLCKSWAKNALITIYLFDSVLSDNREPSLDAVFTETYQWVLGTHECYSKEFSDMMETIEEGVRERRAYAKEALK